MKQKLYDRFEFPVEELGLWREGRGGGGREGGEGGHGEEKEG
jgi:hypothetical protein